MTKYREVAAVTVRPGDLVMESPDHAAQVTRVVTVSGGKVSIFARYLWQASREPEWRLGTFTNRSPILKGVR